MDPVRLPYAPPALSGGTGGRARDGRYLGRIRDVSTRRWDGSGPFSARRTQRKGWFYAAAFTPRYLLGFAIVDAGYLGTAFVYLKDRQTGKFREHKAALPLAFPADFAPSLDAEWNVARGRRRWNITPGDSGWAVRFTGPGLEAELLIVDDQPGLTAISSAPGRPFHHTYKACLLNCQLSVTADGVPVRADGRASIDFSLGYPPRDTRWNWASLSGVTADGAPVAINLVAHFMNGLENAVWLDGELHPVGQAVFEYEPRNTLAEWRVRTVDDAVDITFRPDGERSEDLRAGVLSSVFTQPFGAFEGTLRCAKRGSVAIHGYGVTEQHRAHW